MAAVTANGRPVLALVLTMPMTGAWHAQLEVDADDPLTGSVTLGCDATALVGTVLGVATVVGGACRAELVGGAGGLRKFVDARSYQGVTARSVISELLAGVGERLSTRATAAALSLSLQYWTRARGQAGAALSRIVDALPTATWRVLQDGTIWVGRESWPAAPAAALGLELDRDGASGTVLIAPDAPALAPGMTIGGERVGRVEHRMSRGEPLRTLYWIAS